MSDDKPARVDGEKDGDDRFELENAIKAMFLFHGYRVEPVHMEEDRLDLKRRTCYFRASKRGRTYIVGYTFGREDVGENDLDKFLGRFRKWSPEINRMYITNRAFTPRALRTGYESNILLWQRGDIIREIGRFIVRNYERHHALSERPPKPDSGERPKKEDNEEGPRDSAGTGEDTEGSKTIEPPETTYEMWMPMGAEPAEEEEPDPMEYEEIHRLGIYFDDEVSSTEPDVSETGMGDQKTVIWDMPTVKYLVPKYSAEFITRTLATRTSIVKADLRYIPNYLYEMIIASGGPETKKIIAVDSVSGQVDVWSKIEDAKESPMEGTSTAIASVDEKTAYRIAGEKAQELFVAFCYTLPEEAQRNIRFDALEKYHFEAMVHHGLIRLVSRGTYCVPKWYFGASSGMIMVDSLNLHVTKIEPPQNV